MNEASLGVVLVNVVLLSMLFITSIAVARLRSLFAIVMLTGVYSLVSAMWFVALDAVDVAFTEAAVGAGISTALMLGAMLLTSRTAKADRRWARLGPMLVCLVTGAVLIYATTDLPALGDPDSPANSHVGKDYLELSGAEMGIPNVVTSVLSSYRGFDTLGEAFVVFAAGLAVALLLGFGERSLAANFKRGSQPTATKSKADKDHHVILRVVAKVTIPIIALYALYVQFHGEYSPGGGFQAGVIFAVGVILYSLIFGITAALEAVPASFARGLAATGVILYAGVGFYAIANGFDFLDYDAVLASGEKGIDAVPNATGQHYGIIAIELGVLFAVAGSMLTIFYAFAGRAPEIRDEDW